MTRIQIGILGFDGMQALDAIGPADAFGAALTDADAAKTERLYDVTIIGLSGRRLVCEGGVVIQADVTIEKAPRVDTLIIPGGAGLRVPAASERASKWPSQARSCTTPFMSTPIRTCRPWKPVIAKKSEP